MVEPILTAEPKEASFASTLKRDRLRSLLEDPRTPATTLFIICVDHFGLDEFMAWEPDTLRMELKDELDADPPQVNFDKVWSVTVYLTTDHFFSSLETFIPICNALSGSEADFQDFDPADTDEMSWALTELNLLDPIGDPTKRFSEEIKSYVGAQVLSDGFTKLPPMLSWGVFDTKENPQDRVDMMEDDPVMFNAVFDHQQKNQKGVLQDVNERLGGLFASLRDLPLMNGSTKELLEKIKQST